MSFASKLLLLTSMALASQLAAMPAAAKAPNSAPVEATLGAARYTARDIGNLGGDYVYPQALDPQGRVVGFATRAGTEFSHAFATGPDGAGIIDLCPDHPYVCLATAIGARGDVVGSFDAAEWSKPTGVRMRADGSGFTLLENTPSSTSIAPASVNGRGQVVGSGVGADFRAVAFATRARGQGPRDLGALVAGGTSVARAINASGVIVGEADAPYSRRRAFVLSDRQGLRDLGALNGVNSAATAISDSGLIAGWSEADIVAHHHAFVMPLDGGAMKDLGTLGGTHSEAAGVNDSGLVVGQSSLPGDRVYHAFVADANTGRMVDLNALVELPAGVELTHARAINARGQIAATSNTGQAFLLTPIAPQR